MSIGTGQVLDKYELLEQVGQGGMAVVYRGVDRSLKREVAIKVLHRHLADHPEARDRFEREAQAVAKLHHENILEIFDFSGTDSPESYIVTEFIDGQTLKEFTAEHQPGYPEIGAMITLQVCRALSHAHSLGVLHRDIKPDNIMIRNDGVVKLMDFGIAQMLDLQRMTVTGQLLGSPAYMSPEHVEGKPLDFRTDVFSAGILLYQLVTGELPFKGRNPHEILKRIAECNYPDPRLVNPLVGNELGGIIDRAMARENSDRYADISQMATALEEYIRGSGLAAPREELPRYFAAPASYEMALRPRLLDTLCRRGHALLVEDRVAALELFNRVLTLDPGNREVLGELARLSQRVRAGRLLLLFGAVVIACGAVAGARKLWRSGGRRAAPASVHTAAVSPAVSGVPAASAAPGPAIGPDASPPRDASPTQPAVPVLTGPATPRGRRPRAGATVTAPPDPPPAVEPQPAPGESRKVTLRLFPPTSEYRVGGGPWQHAPSGQASLQLEPGAVAIEARNDACCAPTRHVVPADARDGSVSLTLDFLPAQLTLECRLPGVRAQVDGRHVRIGTQTTIPIRSTTGQVSVELVFVSEDSRIDRHDVRLSYREDRVIACRL